MWADVDVEGSIPVGVVGETRRSPDAGVGEVEVDRIQFGLCPLDDAPNLLGTCDTRTFRESRSGVPFIDAVRNRGGSFRVEIGHQHLGTLFCGETFGDHSADAVSTAGHDGDLPCNLHEAPSPSPCIVTGVPFFV